MTAKIRVAPIKALTLPKLELMGAVIAARLLSYIRNAYVETSFGYTMWTDSMMTLG